MQKKNYVKIKKDEKANIIFKFIKSFTHKEIKIDFDFEEDEDYRD